MDTKVQEKTLNELINFEELNVLLKGGDLLQFETRLAEYVKGITNEVSEELIVRNSIELQCSLKILYGQLGFKKLAFRETSIQIGTGHVFNVPSLYAKKVQNNYCGSRHLIDKYFGIIGNASPLYYNSVGMCAAICPSYDIGNEVLMQFGVIQCTSRIRNLTMVLAEKCHAKEAELILSKEDDLTGKRVVIEIDGGRTRTRESTGKKTSKGFDCYDTPWREPKLFTIRIVDENGDLVNYFKPIYGVRFSENGIISLLESFLGKR